MDLCRIRCGGFGNRYRWYGPFRRAIVRATRITSATPRRTPWSMARLASSSAATSAPPIRCGAPAAGFQRIGETARAFLAGADHHRVGGDQAGALGGGDPQALRGDPVVAHARPQGDALRPEARAVDPAGGAAKALAERAGFALQEGHLARARRGPGRDQAARHLGRIAHAPFGAPGGEVVGRALGVGEKLGDVEADPAGADDGDAGADAARRPAPRG